MENMVLLMDFLTICGWWPVYRGLGSQIYQYAYFVRYDPTCKSFFEQGRDFMDRYYLTDKELLAVLDK